MTTLVAIILAFPSIHVANSLAVNSSLSQHEPSPSTLLATASVDAANITASCKDLDTCRSLYSIIQTCVATIFACVWVAVHRNIPAPKQKHKWNSNLVLKAAQWIWFKIVDQKQSFVVFTVTLLAPEWVLAWAIRQMLVARRVAGELEDARKVAKRNWEDIDRGCVEVTVAETDVDRSSGSDGISLRSSSSDNEPLIEKQSNEDDIHPPGWKTNNECTRII